MGTPEAAAAPVTVPSVTLTKLASMDDPEAFLELFEHAAAAWEWLEEEWAL